MNIIKRSMAMFLVLCMLVGLVPMNVFADETDSTNTTVTESLEEIKETTEEVTGEETEETTEEVTEEATEEVIEEVVEEVTEEVTEPIEKIIEVTEVIKTEAKNAGVQTAELTYAEDYRILHLDCGRKYFSVDWIKALINEMAAAGYTHLQLAFGNNGMRFLLDNMSVTVNGTTYSSGDVTAAIKAGNEAYNSRISTDSGVSYSPAVNELTQNEMDIIINHAHNAGIEIIPLLNNPGHMNAIVSAITSLTGEDASYNGSVSTIDLADDDAVEFTQILVKKYMDYFASMGCNEFNIGADEYANDAGNGQFSNLITYGYYDDFINYLNTLASYAVDKGMIPMAFNDGIYYNHNTNNGIINENIMVCYWSSGWSGYDLASASFLDDQGFKIINTHGSYYFILTSNGITNPSDKALNFDKTAFYGNFNITDPAGSMFCIWCDIPGSATEQEVAAAARITLRKMAAAMKGTTDYSSDVVSDGFNANGTIAETREWCVVPADTTDVAENSIQVGGYELTSADAIKVSGTEIPVIEDAEEVIAWNITPYVGTAEYTERGTVSIPVPDDWNEIRGGVVKTAYGEAFSGIKGTLENGNFTFAVPHFSTVYAYNLDSSAIDYNETINLEVGGTEQIVIKDVEYNGVYETNPTGIASVVAEHKKVEGSLNITPATSFVDGSSYYIINSDKKYMSADLNWVNTADEAVAWTASYYFSAGILSYYYLSYNGEYLCDLNYNGNWSKGGKNDAALFSIVAGSLGNSANYEEYTAATVSGTAAVNQSTITFTGITPGTTYATVGDTTYRIVVTGKVDITIKYIDQNGNEIKRETVPVDDSATTYTLFNFNYGGKFYTIEDKTLDITPNTITEYTVTVSETEENLTNVTPLTIEYWQTNSHVNAPEKESANQMSVAASDAYSEAGLTLIDIIPATGYRAGNPVVYWRSRLLTNDERQESGDGSADCTWSGIGFTKVRYWNGSWAVFTDDNVWQNVVLDNNQLVAYYMNDLHLADEVKVGTSDWAKKGNVQPDASSEGFVSIVFQVVYEGGTSSPADVTTDMVGDYSYLVNAWRSAGQVQRGVGTIALTKVGNYEICKVTATTGTHTLKSNNTIESIAWLNNERVLFEDEEHPVSQYTIHNPSQPENVIKDEEHENLYWDDNNESILIRIYVKAVETEDSLKVVYYDEKFGDTLTGYNIIVPNGSNFNNGIVKADTANLATLPAFDNSTTRKNANGYGIVNSLKKTQNFTTDLTRVPNVMGKYNSALYVYNGSEISEDGTTLTHYYTINTEIFSPNFVADFGLPLTFQLSQIIGEGQDELVDEVTVNQKTRYGTLSYDDENKVFTYTPTRILQGIDVLTINILFENETSATTTNVGVTPATTVYYEESFVEWGTGWTGGNQAITVENQAAEKIGDYENNNNFGYDGAYADVYTNGTGASNGTNATTATIGEKGTFTFAGTGIQIFANCTQGSGYVAVEVRDSNGKAVKLSMVDTAVSAGTTSATAGQQGSMYGLPVVSLVDLKNMKHDTYTVNIIKIMDDEPVSIDGIRVFNTIEDSTIFKADLEDSPKFYELRDMVLYALEVDDNTSGEYGSLGEMATQVYDEVVAQTANNATTDKVTAVITSPTGIYGDGATVQDLLNNGPKNELYLYKEQTLTFKVKTNRLMQLGLKAPKGSTNYTFVVNYENGTITESVANKTLDISTSVDMFYSLGNKNGTERTYTVTVTNNGDNILSVTLLKICDDPNASFEALTAKDMEYTLTAMGYTFPEEETKNPSKPSSSETTVVPEDTKEDIKEDESSSVPTEVVKVEVADSEETSKGVKKENNATSSVEDEANKSEEVVETETAVEEDAETGTETDIQENEILESEKAEESSGNPMLVIGIAIAILAVITAAIFGFKKNKKK